jgi:hypothetical protein
MIKIFKRKCWTPDASYPNGFAPHAVSMDSCKTIKTVETELEAIDYCGERNSKWLRLVDKVWAERATPFQVKTYHNADRYEFTKVGEQR